MIVWERSRAARVYGIIWGTRVKTNMEQFSPECHSVDCRGDSKVLIELGSNKIEVVERSKSESINLSIMNSHSLGSVPSD